MGPRATLLTSKTRRPRPDAGPTGPHYSRGSSRISRRVIALRCEEHMSRADPGSAVRLFDQPVDPYPRPRTQKVGQALICQSGPGMCNWQEEGEWGHAPPSEGRIQLLDVLRDQNPAPECMGARTPPWVPRGQNTPPDTVQSGPYLYPTSQDPTQDFAPHPDPHASRTPPLYA